MFKFSGSSYLTSALGYSLEAVPRRCALVGLVTSARVRNKHRAALEAILESSSNAQRFILLLENESEAGMLGLQEFEQQFAFKDLMIHLILQFTLHIAFRGVLHRCGNQEIHR